MYKLLVAVKSCHRDRTAGFHEAIRGTWGRMFGKDVLVRFFMGHNPDLRDGSPLKSDEVVIDAPDTYEGLPQKTRQICKWIQGRMVGRIFLCDCDTIVNPVKLMALPFEVFDYAGYFRDGNTTEQFFYQDHQGVYPESYPWASGGFGYFLSRDAASEVADVWPLVWAEDMHVGQVLGPLVQKGIFTVGALPMLDAVSHFRKSQKFPQFTPALLHRAFRDGGPEKIYEEAKQ